ncbi:ABC transporter permease [Fibrella aquatilis]|uniref:ABC transporter permease n=1 Tax=Fibrella aquatilis TaxID=2817059 RepID=A0A939K2K1_9BACT|nr:ABC transporter permease [Fibrella aquatilis]MBO0934658.1 ABC transporter permease [Fibrella aquatilis]
MIKNYITIALRNLRKNGAYAFINIAGLGLGLGCALLLFALVRYHYRTDKHHSKFDRIYRFTSASHSPDGDFYSTGVPYPFGNALRTDHPEIEHVAMLEEQEEPTVMVPGTKGEIDRKFKEDNAKGAYAEPSYFQIFDYTWLAGGPTNLAGPNTVVLSAKLATKYFRTTNAIGRTVTLNGRIPARVVGIFTDYADNTDFAYEFIGSWASMKAVRGGDPLDEDFGNINSSTLCFALLNSRYSVANWNHDAAAFLRKHNTERAKKVVYLIQSLGDIHFATAYDGVDKNLILSLFIIGLFLVITACINFVNLATAQALNRAREVGVRKVLGSTRGQLLGQFMGETTLIVALALLVAIGVFSYGLSLVQTYLHGVFRFTFDYTPSVVAWLTLLVVGVILLAGLYPALVLAGFRPVVALAGKIMTQRANGTPPGGFTVRRGLVVAQFAISQMLIIGLVVVTNQLHYIQSKDLGFRKEAIMTIGLPNVPSQDVAKMSTFRNLAMALPDVAKFSYSMSGAPQADWINSGQINYDNRPDEARFSSQRKSIDANYVDLFGLTLVAGRNLAPSDTAREVLVNETFVRKLGINDPTQVLGKMLHNVTRTRHLEIVGVVKDFNQTDLKNAIEPLFMTTQANNYFRANLQLRTAAYQRVIKQLEAAYNQVYPDNYFAHQFVDDQIQARYQEEQTMGRLVNFFAAVALFIGCMGLYGLVLFMVTQRTKEIGVRKVLGASVGSILWLLNREFVRLIVIAFAVAAPVAWYVMRGWLSSFEYRILIGPAIFGSSLLITVLVATLTVGFQSIRAALMNPVTSLRSE